MLVHQVLFGGSIFTFFRLSAKISVIAEGIELDKAVRQGLGQPCNHTLWKSTSEPFNFYFRNLGFALLDQTSKILESKKNNTGERVSQEILRSSLQAANVSISYLNWFEELEVTNKSLTQSAKFLSEFGICAAGGGGIVLNCSPANQCICDQRNYVAKNGTCFGKLYTVCGGGLECVNGLVCVPFEQTTAKTEMGLGLSIGQCGGSPPMDDVLYRAKYTIQLQADLRQHLGSKCNHTLWKTYAKPFVEVVNFQKCTTLYGAAECSKRWMSATRIRSDWISSASDFELTNASCAGGLKLWCSAQNTCICSKYSMKEERGTCVTKIHETCGMGAKCESGLECIPHYQDCPGPECVPSLELYEASNQKVYFRLGLGFCGGRLSFEQLNQKLAPSTRLQHLIEGILSTVLTMLGLVGNTFSLVVLTKNMYPKSTTCLLLWLTLYDSIFLIGQLVETGVLNTALFFGDVSKSLIFGYTLPVMKKYFRLVKEFGNCGSIYITLLISLERLIVISYPLKVKMFCTLNKTIFATIAVACFSIAYSLPIIFELKVEPAAEEYSNPFAFVDFLNGPRLVNDTLYNYAEYSSQVYQTVPTELAFDESYVKFKFWCKIIVKVAIPTVCLGLMNGLICIQLRRAAIVRSELGIESNLRCNANATMSSTTRMTISVVILFVLCYLPLLVYEIFFSVPIFLYFEEPYLIWTDDYIADTKFLIFVRFFITLNSSLNFVIYFWLSEKFRNVLTGTVKSWLTICRIL